MMHGQKNIKSSNYCSRPKFDPGNPLR